jgi:hypothetical protein
MYLLMFLLRVYAPGSNTTLNTPPLSAGTASGRAFVVGEDILGKSIV